MKVRSSNIICVAEKGADLRTLHILVVRDILGVKGLPRVCTLIASQRNSLVGSAYSEFDKETAEASG